MRNWKTKGIEKRQRALVSQTEQGMLTVCAEVEETRRALICELDNMNKQILAIDERVKKMQACIENYMDVAQKDRTVTQECMEEQKRIMIDSGTFFAEKLDKAQGEEKEYIESSLRYGAEMLSNEIKEIKTVIQLLAVNELLDEIEISETKR